ncbi:hypothetical protein M422DRAFT_258328 [Sphaerobolus stellatus SS14]|uniref:Uncharacterized protein n=1 Tax=Sphaerobolus stellatus (strain SS14) TaxID=990650 RepID=A0A0C9VMN9_SPHS4|nr:hypothetical protein M422DRAFT_258328 [Sphaerobolus stellatus SS14]
MVYIPSPTVAKRIESLVPVDSFNAPSLVDKVATLIRMIDEWFGMWVSLPSITIVEHPKRIILGGESPRTIVRTLPYIQSDYTSIFVQWCNNFPSVQVEMGWPFS